MTPGELHFEVTSFIRDYPILFFPLMRINKRLRRLESSPLVTAKTEVVIEGFFRCGNTFAWRAFLDSQDRAVVVAFHSHAPASIIRAAKLRIPTLVLIREPRETILSLMVRQPQITISQGFRAYINYYNRIYPWRHAYTIGVFNRVTTDFGSVIERLNKKFGTDFTPFNHNPETERRVFAHFEHDDIQRFSGPSADREVTKNQLRRSLDSPAIRPLISESEKIYNEIVKASA